MKRLGKLAGFWSLIFCVLLVLSTGCSSEEISSKNNKEESDVALETDAQNTTDVDNQDKDTEIVTDVEGDVAADVEGDVNEEADAQEVETDAPEVEDGYEDRPLGQCNEDLECKVMAGGYRDCRAHMPGGVCGACGLGDCGVTAECVSGACQETCTTKEDCAPGLTCKSTGTCGLEVCKNNKCPTPMFGCSDSGFCERIKCQDQAECPEQTTCTKGLCIENRQL